MGDFIDRLQATPAWDNLLVVCTADHGFNHWDITSPDFPHIPFLVAQPSQNFPVSSLQWHPLRRKGLKSRSSENSVDEPELRISTRIHSPCKLRNRDGNQDEKTGQGNETETQNKKSARENQGRKSELKNCMKPQGAGSLPQRVLFIATTERPTLRWPPTTAAAWDDADIDPTNESASDRQTPDRSLPPEQG